MTKPKVEYRLCVKFFSSTRRYNKRDLAHAKKDLEQHEDGYWGGKREAWIESREVTPWRKL